MGRPPTKPIVLKDGWYIEVRNKGSRSGVKLRRDTEDEMNQAIKDFARSKDVIVLGETKSGKWMNDKK
ncbi:MAG: hypothetical protein HRT72_01840 [Flavobacteriales bacterium]|nr:hypothetical protein [Flavobacteriales bacterium]